MGMYVGKSMKNMDEKEISDIVIWLRTIIEDPTKNLADIVKFVHDIPGQVTLGSLVSSLWETTKTAKKFADYAQQATRNWEMFPVKYVWDDAKIGAAIQNVFWWKFLPSRTFTKSELDKAAIKSDWTYINTIFKDDTFGIYRDDLGWWKYKLTSDGKRTLWVYEQPSKSAIVDSLGNWNKGELEKGLRPYLWDDYNTLIMDWEIIDNMRKILSDTIC
jgi:hypothetical protein